MRLLLIFLFTLFSFFLIGQERLTSIVNQAQEELIYLQKIDEVNYVLKTNPSDELQVFLLNDDFTLTHLYTNIFDNIYNDILPLQIIGEHVYTFDGIDPVKYDFVANKEIRYVLPEGWFPILWFNAGTKLPSVSTKNASSNDSKSFTLGENGEINEEDEENFCYNVFGNFIIKSSRSATNLRPYFVENIDSGVRDTLVSTAAFFDFKIENDGNDLVYLDLENHIRRYDGKTGNISLIPNLLYDDSLYESYRWIGDYLILLHRNEEQISVFNAIDGSRTHIFNFEEFPFVSFSDLPFTNILENKIVLQTSRNALVLDLLTQNVSYYDTHNTRWYANPIIDDRYFIAYDFVLVENEYVLASKLVDLSDYSEIDLNFIGPINMIDYVKVISVGDDYLGAFWSDFYLEETVFRISKESMSMVHEPNVQPPATQGLPDVSSKLFKLGDNIAFVAENNIADGRDDIYAVEGDQVELVVSEMIYDFYPSGFIKLKNQLTYAVEQEDEWDIYSFDGKTATLEAKFPIPASFAGTAGYLDNYVIANDNVFAVIQSLGFDNGHSLWRYNKSNGIAEELIELEGLLFNPLSTDGNNTYFYSEPTLYHVDEQGTIEDILEVENADFISASIRQSGDHTYFLSTDGIYILEAKSAIKIYDKAIDHALLNLEYSGSRDYVNHPLLFDISFDVEHTLIYLDGPNLTEVNVGAQVSSVNVQENNFFFIYTTPGATGPRKFLLYNGASNQLFDLTYLNETERVLNIHGLDSTAYVVTYERFTEILNIYRMSADFSEANLVFTSPVDSYTSDPNFRILGGEGMLYTNDFIFQVDEDYQFHELNVSGNASTPEMEINEDGYIYFIAKDEEYGTQLFRVSLVSERVGTNDLRPIESIKVYPNPSQNLIFVSDELAGEYTILNQIGQILSSGTLSQSRIDIRSLNEGMYFLKIENEDKIFISTFVKSN